MTIETETSQKECLFPSRTISAIPAPSSIQDGVLVGCGSVGKGVALAIWVAVAVALAVVVGVAVSCGVGVTHGGSPPPGVGH